jgi:hypothetical protein
MMETEFFFIFGGAPLAHGDFCGKVIPFPRGEKEEIIQA